MILYDSFVIDGVRRTGDGYLAAFAKVARTGIQIYKGRELGRPDLDTVRVYRPAEEVFHADAMKSYAHRPVTLKHPAVPVTSKNWKRFAGGQTGADVVRDGEYVSVPMVMMDAALIDAYEKDGIKELSMGYSTDIKWRTGVTDSGEAYDAVQTAIRANHLAVVPVARGGDQLRIGDEESAVEDSTDDNSNEGDYPMKLMIDGLAVNVADEQSGTIIEKHIATLDAQLVKLNDDFAAFKKKKAADDEEMAEGKKTCDALTGEVAVLKKQVADAAITPQVLDAMVQERTAVSDKAKTLLGDKYDFAGKTLEQIRRDAIVAKLGDAAKDMNDGAIEGAFRYATLDAKVVTADAQIANAISHRPHSSAVTSVDARDAAFDELTKRTANAWKTPASSH